MSKYAQKKGREQKGKWVQLPHWMLQSDAYRSLHAYSRSLLIEIKYRYNGNNNGYIGLSVREAAEAINTTKDTAAKYLIELEQKGFVKIRQMGTYRVKNRHSTEFILTDVHFNEQPPTKDFMKWRGEN